MESPTLDNQLRGKLPLKIDHLTISGEKLKSISRTALQVSYIFKILWISNQRDVRRRYSANIWSPYLFCINWSFVFQGVQAKSLTLALRNNGIKELNRDLFQNLGQVRWLQLELRHNALTSIAEPSTSLYPGTGDSVFLTSLYMSNNPWSCSCAVG